MLRAEAVGVANNKLIVTSKGGAITSAFTCAGPYAVLIMLGIKRVENRNVLPEPVKGRCAIGCSKLFNAAEYGNFVQWAAQHLPSNDFERIPAWADVKDWPGKIVGCCDYEAGTCATNEWNEGYPYWWKLSEVVCFGNPIPCCGNVGMWQMPSVLAAQVTAADLLERSVGAVIATEEDARRIFRVAIPIAGRNEGLFVLPLDAERRALASPILVSLGEATTTTVDPGDVFSAALQVGAKAIIVAHNHPSGDLTPSKQDERLTVELKRLGGALGVCCLDHLGL